MSEKDEAMKRINELAEREKIQVSCSIKSKMEQYDFAIIIISILISMIFLYFFYKYKLNENILFDNLTIFFMKYIPPIGFMFYSWLWIPIITIIVESFIISKSKFYIKILLSFICIWIASTIIIEHIITGGLITIKILFNSIGTFSVLSAYSLPILLMVYEFRKNKGV